MPIKVFWPVDVETLPPHTIEQKTTESGDECHFNITGMSDKQARKYFREQDVTPHKCRTCTGAIERPLAVADLDILRKRYPPIGLPPREE